MSKILKYFWLPLLLLIVSGFLIVNAQKELLQPQKITFSSSLNNSTTGAKSDQKISDVPMSKLMEAQQNTTYLMQKYGIGQLIIPEVNINLPIYNTPTNETLSSGVAKYNSNWPFLKGNTVLAAHNFLESHVLLYNLKDLKPRDYAYITDYKKVYVFKVTSNEIMNQSHTEVLEQTKLPTLTLIRCVGGVGTPNRLIVKGDLVKTRAITAADKKSWNISTGKPKVKSLSFVAEGLAKSYQNKFLDWRLMIILAINLLAIIWAIVMSVKKDKNIPPEIETDISQENEKTE